MALFSEVFKDLKAGKSLSRDEWETVTRIYYDGPNLVQQRGDGRPYYYQVDGEAMTAEDWYVVNTRWVQVPINAKIGKAA